MTRREPVLSLEERRALAVIDARLTHRHPELAAALTFGRRPVPPPGKTSRVLRRVRRAAVGLATISMLAYAWFWGTTPPGPCAPGAGMTNHAALAAAADFSRPMPDNVGCVMPDPNRTG